MPRLLNALAEWVHHRPLVHRCARAAVRLVPDIPLTRRFGEFGRVRFRLRQHRYMLWQELARADWFMLGVFDRIVRPGDVVYDVGANIGLYTRFLTTWFGAGQVIAFEPMRANFAILKANVALGGIGDRVRMLPIALSNTDGEEDLQVDDITSGTAVLSTVSGGEASVGRKNLNLPPRTERVSVVRLDRLMKRGELPAPQVIKIDTEGAETLVVEGAQQTLLEHQPRLAVATHGPDKATAVIRLLNGLGYYCYGFVYEGGEDRYTRLQPEHGDRLADNNFIASFDEAEVREPLKPRPPGCSMHTSCRCSISPKKMATPT